MASGLQKSTRQSITRTLSESTSKVGGTQIFQNKPDTSKENLTSRNKIQSLTYSRASITKTTHDHGRKNNGGNHDDDKLDMDVFIQTANDDVLLPSLRDSSKLVSTTHSRMSTGNRLSGSLPPTAINMALTRKNEDYLK